MRNWKQYVIAAARTNTGAAVLNLLLVYVALMLTRLVFFFENYSVFAPFMSRELAWSVFKGGLLFDTAAVFYLNALFIVMMLLPLHLKERPVYHTVTKWVFVVCNSLGLAANLMDSVYFQYTGRRSTATVFTAFSNEGNVTSIIFTELLRHWYLVLVFAALVAMLWFLYVRPDALRVFRRGWHYYVTLSVSLLLIGLFGIWGTRGGTLSGGTKAMAANRALQYVNRAIEANLVLNTPFTIIRSIGKNPFVTPHYMSDEEMQRIYTPVITPPAQPDSLALGKKNVVIVMVESMGKEYVGAYNDYEGYMPFVSELAAKSMTFKYSYANGRVSMDAMPSVLASVPMMVESFFMTPAALNDLDGIPALLKQEGYFSAYFHGGHNQTLGFSAFAKHIGFDQYFGLDEYCDDDNYNGMDDFDGKWAIWDEPFLQFTIDKINTFSEPFFVNVFTASSHHPYNVPNKYSGDFPDEGSLPIYRCVRYTDMALRRFFERAKEQLWFNNTLFVIVADHTNLTERTQYQTDLGLYAVPIMFYTPDGSITPQMRDDIVVQQTDVMPTLLHYLGYTKPFFAFGKDLLTATPEGAWAFVYNNEIFQYIKGDYMLQFDGEKVKAVYNFKTDPLLEHNIAGKVPEQDQMEREIKAYIQQYMGRMNENRLKVD